MTERHFLVDTNVISELSRSKPDPLVLSFFEAAARFSISVMVLHELQFGLEVLNDPNKLVRLTAFNARVRNRFSLRALPITLDIADVAARMRALARRNGRVLALADALIGATSLAHGLTLATRNVKDFAELDVPLFDPFTAA